MQNKTGLKTLGNLSPARGSNVVKKRLGRGTGSGLGKPSAPGGKGQTARKGGGIRAGFEGGQTPLYRRLPKRGFTNPFRVEFNVVNIEVLACFDAGTKITPDLLKSKGLLRNPGLPVKILGRGKVEKKFVLAVDKVSASAKVAIEKAGGSVEVKG
ncbi:MAG: 50S ribosomal protein L15 [Proteobacteria bacterium]|nr:50S ribosomal protein L15 [Pseudomonadota bacterium]